MGLLVPGVINGAGGTTGLCIKPTTKSFECQWRSPLALRRLGTQFTRGLLNCCITGVAKGRANLRNEATTCQQLHIGIVLVCDPRASVPYCVDHVHIDDRLDLLEVAHP